MSQNQHKLNSSNNKLSVFSVLKTTLLAASVSVLAACGGGGGGGSEPTPKSDTKAPSVVSVSPDNGAKIAKKPTITVTFSENVKGVNKDNVSLTKSGSSDSADLTIAGSGKTYTIKPNADLEVGASYTLTLKKAIADTAGNKLAADVIKTYTVSTNPDPAPNPGGGGTADTTAPTVSANPSNGALGGNADKTPTIRLTFSETVKNVNDTNVELKKGSVKVGVSISGQGKEYTVKPNADLEAGAYTLTLKVGITDNANNPLASAQSYSYTVTYTPEVSIITPQTLFKTGGDVRISGKRLKDVTVGFGAQNLTPSEQNDTFIKVTLPAQSAGTRSIKVGQSTHSVTFKDNYTKIASGSGSRASCGLLPDKTVECWGSGFDDAPKPVSGLNNVADIATGEDFQCALLADTTVKCWGSINGSGQLGNGSSSGGSLGFVKNSHGNNLSDVTKLAVGWAHACALLNNGTIQCWGKNTDGQLGDNTRTNRSLAVEVKGSINNAKEITAGGAHTCAILDDNSVKCWGLNNEGQLGDNSRTSKSLPAVTTGLQAKAISAGHLHTCAVLTDNPATAKCWGKGASGQLGHGSAVNRYVPTAVSNISDVVSISTGRVHTCAMLKGGKAKCWGYNGNGKLGNNNTAQVTSPVDVVSPSGSGQLANVTSIMALRRHTCATFSDKPTHCWGNNYLGKLGNGTDTHSKVPAPIIAGRDVAARNMNDVKQVAAGESHNCSLLIDNSVKCWGKNNQGQLGDGNTSPTDVKIDAAIKANGISNAKEVSLGRSHSCALLADKTIKCWGGYSTYQGELGDGNKRTSTTPVDVKGINNAIQLSVFESGQHGCALLDDGSVKCWGYNGYAQIGDGTRITAFEPRAVSNLRNVAQVATGDSHSCALLKDKTVKCWGSNAKGQLGVASADTPDRCSTLACSKVPVTVKGVGGTGVLSNVTQIALGHEHTCALLGNGSIKCWGKGDSGRLGNNSNATSAFPVAVSGISTAQKLALGGSHGCALLADNTVKCWGKNSYGQLGDDSKTNRNVPVNMRFKGKVDDISAGTYNTLLLQGSLVVPVGG